MWEIILLYFGINTLLAIMLWFSLGLQHVSISGVGFFLTVILLGLPILVILLVVFVIALGAGAAYNLGDFLQNFFKKIKV